jgi:hypothetical protein
VKDVETQSGLNVLPLQPDGAPRQDVSEFSPGPGNGYASVNGLYFDEDKVAVLNGQMANPKNAHEFRLTAQEAQSMGVRVGDVVRFGIYTNAQIAAVTILCASVGRRAVAVETLRPSGRVTNATLTGQFPLCGLWYSPPAAWC